MKEVEIRISVVGMGIRLGKNFCLTGFFGGSNYFRKKNFSNFPNFQGLFLAKRFLEFAEVF